MRHTRPIALVSSIVFTVAGLAGTAFALTNENGTSAPTKSGLTSKQVQAILARYEAAKDQAEVDTFLKALDERERFLEGVAAQQKADEQRRAAAAARAKAQATARASRAAAAPRGAAYGPWGDLINRYPWPRDVAYRVMMCESKGDANAYNPRSGATGLFQILNGPYDPAANVALAYQMWSSRGWQPWRACI